ncbi:DUF535 family protein [Rhizobium sp. SSA_523]|uniref:VirK/YbjX family protein n=1 Tax=Rhizobium sp. SSA_523 TaxID=2952477 RepID=UPI00209153F3|nr:DUF535 family protein [Rhizobium sp. SSA_523]MCO5730441.1 VirK/YbjX family protein [Rhizobium sp. SSA_523]WKC25484.1 DUF535 family protein [Rhizobium sp. SSA_523]
MLVFQLMSLHNLRFSFFVDAWALAQHLHPGCQPEDWQGRLRFLLRALLSHHAAAPWLRYLRSTPGLQPQLIAFPFIAAKPLSKYMRRGWRVEDRVRCMLDHYRTLLSSVAGRRILALSRMTGVIATLKGRTQTDYHLVITCNAAQRREGELILELRKNSRRICCLCGSFCRSDRRLVFLIGTMQGANGADAKDVVREATRDLHQLRPRDLIMAAAQTIATLLGAEAILAPTQTRHLAAGRRRPTGIKADFDSLWTDLGGICRPDGDYLLPAVTHYRPLESIAAKRRAETLRRYALKQQMAAEIEAALLSPGPEHQEEGTGSAPIRPPADTRPAMALPAENFGPPHAAAIAIGTGQDLSPA